MYKAILAVAATVISVSASAATTVTVLPTDTSVSTPWGTVATGNAPSENSGGGYSVVSGTQAYNGNGSLELHGDRTRYQIGQIYAGPSLFALDDLSALTFDWRVGTAGNTQLHAAPAIRLHIIDPAVGAGGSRSEMIWERVYDGGASGVVPPLNVWTTEADPIMYVNVRSNGAAFELATGLNITEASNQGVAKVGNSQRNSTIASWNQYFSPDAYVTGISIGAGGSFGNQFIGFVDALKLTVGGEDVTFNFENAAAAVPEPAALALLGLGVAGVAARRRRRTA